ncbi:MAG: hypothetical protein CBC74_006440 [Crocinitomicaceae bacterium TMED114]|nr:MAG: hypothetical protein CBC74_006440 [Crocinitomicaceae bacterium TMED114]
MPGIDTENFEKVEVHSAADLRHWLHTHHGRTDAVWLVTWKKVRPDRYVSTGEVLDELLCFGWIDGVRRKLDDERTMQLISARRAQHWARTYKERAQRLIDDGRMAPPGQAAIDRSKKEGLWNFMDDVDNLVVPDDLLAALKPHAAAFAFFMAINDSSKRFVLRWLKLTKTEATRRKRIAQLVSLSARGEKLPGS